MLLVLMAGVAAALVVIVQMEEMAQVLLQAQVLLVEAAVVELLLQIKVGVEQVEAALEY
jgi:hypothetical protein